MGAGAFEKGGHVRTPKKCRRDHERNERGTSLSNIEEA